MGGERSALFLAAAALLIVVVAARGASPVPSELNDVSLDRGLPPVSISGGDDFSGNGPLTAAGDPQSLARIVVGLLVVLFVLAAVLSVLSALRTRRLGVGRVVEPVEGTVDTVPRLRLREAVRQARDVLAREGGRPGDAVVEAWVTLENATGHTRAPHQTATEFTVALLAGENADEVALRELRTLYQRARFGVADDIGDEDAARARAALDRILVTVR